MTTKRILAGSRELVLPHSPSACDVAPDDDDVWVAHGALHEPGVPGGSVPVAYVVHAVVAIPAVLTTLWLWTCEETPFDIKATAAVIATLMIQPYILHYDLAWLLPIVYLCRDRAPRNAWTQRERAIVCLAWCLPLLSLLPSYFPAILPPAVLGLPALFVITIATNCRKASHSS